MINNEGLLLQIIKLIVGIIIKADNDTFINYMIELSGDDSERMQTICQDAMNMVNSMSTFDPNEVPQLRSENSHDPQAEAQYLDRINDLNMQIESMEMEKKTMRLELSEEK